MHNSDLIVVHRDVPARDASILLDGFPPDHPLVVGQPQFAHLVATGIEAVEFDTGQTLAHIMQRAGVFPSVADARRNGWNKPIPDGYSQFIVGKRKLRIFILNHTPGTYPCP